MIIKVDSREKKLWGWLQLLSIEFLTDTNDKEKLSLEKKTLELGDIILSDDQDDEIIIIERKTLQDLGSSIKDGRYKEQSFRLNQCSCKNHNIIYIIEGDLETFKEKHGIKKKTLRTAIFSLNYYKGFSVLRTKSVKETAKFILSMSNNLIKYKEGFSIGKNEELTYSDVSRRIKKNNVTTDNIGEIMLSQIPKISAATAKVFMEEYKTISQLLKAIKEDPQSLNNLKIINKKGKARKINKPAIQNLIKFLS